MTDTLPLTRHPAARPPSQPCHSLRPRQSARNAESDRGDGTDGRRARIRGIKLYPAQYYRGRTIPHRLDDPLLGHPLIERAIELGIKSVAVHKAAPFGPMSANPFDVGDVDHAAGNVPGDQLRVVHSGFAFLEETAFLLRLPNFWQLEVTSSLILNQRDALAEAWPCCWLTGRGSDRAGDRLHARPCPPERSRRSPPSRSRRTCSRSTTRRSSPTTSSERSWARTSSACTASIRLTSGDDQGRRLGPAPTHGAGRALEHRRLLCVGG